MIKSNKKMQKLLTEIPKTINTKRKLVHLPTLMNLVWPDFIEVEGCVLLNLNREKVMKLNMKHILSSFGDRTGFEAFENHVHMIDYVKRLKDNPIEGLSLALNILEIWECKLLRDFPDYKFQLILWYDGKEDTILRFYKFRQEEGSWIDFTKIESDQEGAVLVKEIGTEGNVT